MKMAEEEIEVSEWKGPDAKRAVRRVGYTMVFLMAAVPALLISDYFNLDKTSVFITLIPVLLILSLLGIYDIYGITRAVKTRKGIAWNVFENILFGILLGLILDLKGVLLFALLIIALLPGSLFLNRNHRVLELKTPVGFSFALHFKLMDAVEKQLVRQGVQYRRQGNEFRLRGEGKRDVLIEVGTEDAYAGLSNEIVIKRAKKADVGHYENLVNAAVMSISPLSSFSRSERFFCPSCKSPVVFDLKSGTFFCNRCHESVRYEDALRRA